jgi:glutathione S-transferase kappa 1
LKPFFLGGIMNTSGNQPPATNPSKAVYLASDIMLLSDYWKVPLVTPQTFPVNTLSVQRLLNVLYLSKVTSSKISM